MWRKVSRPAWQVKQTERLEQARAQEKASRDAWFAQQTQREEEEQEDSAGQGTWVWQGATSSTWWGGKWWSSSWGWQQNKWIWKEEGAAGASSSSAAGRPTTRDQESLLPPRSLAEDLSAFRAATMTPTSFASQRNFMLALGRPVSVLLSEVSFDCLIYAAKYVRACYSFFKPPFDFVQKISPSVRRCEAGSTCAGCFLRKRVDHLLNT